MATHRSRSFHVETPVAKASLGSARALRARGGDPPKSKFPRGNSSRQGLRSVRHGLSGPGVATSRSRSFHVETPVAKVVARFGTNSAASGWRHAGAASFHVETPVAVVAARDTETTREVATSRS